MVRERTNGRRRAAPLRMPRRQVMQHHKLLYSVFRTVPSSSSPLPMAGCSARFPIPPAHLPSLLSPAKTLTPQTHILSGPPTRTERSDYGMHGQIKSPNRFSVTIEYLIPLFPYEPPKKKV